MVVPDLYFEFFKGKNPEMCGNILSLPYFVKLPKLAVFFLQNKLAIDVEPVSPGRTGGDTDRVPDSRPPDSEVILLRVK